MRKNVVCLLVLTIVLTLATVPNARAQTTSITNLQTPSTAAVGSGVHITFTVSYSPGNAGAAIVIAIADADTAEERVVTGSIFSSTPNGCKQGTRSYSAYCVFTVGSNAPGSLYVDFVFNPPTPQTYHLEAVALVLDKYGGQLSASISRQTFTIVVPDSSIFVAMNGPSVVKQDLDFVIDGVQYTAKQGYTEVPVSSGQHTIEVPMYYYSLNKDVRAVFNGWEEFDFSTSHVVHRYLPNIRQVNLQKERKDLTAAYVIQYYLNLTTPFGSASGEGWYNASSTAHFSVKPVQSRLEGILGLLGAKANFAHWQGDVTVMPASGEIVMNSPHVLQAVWQTDLSAVYISAGGLGVFLLVLSIAGAYTYKRRQVILDFSWLRNYMEKHGAVVVQDIRCPYCGGNVRLPDRGTYTNCIHCGHAVYVKQIFDLVKEAIDRA